MSKKNKEEQLNNSLTNCYSEEDAVENFIYLTSKRRGKNNRTTVRNIERCYRENRLGSLLRRLDPMSFNCS